MSDSESDSESTKLRCPNEYMGCKQKLTKKELTSHVKTCVFGMETKQTKAVRNVPLVSLPVNLEASSSENEEDNATQTKPKSKSSGIFSKLRQLKFGNSSGASSSKTNHIQNKSVVLHAIPTPTGNSKLIKNLSELKALGKAEPLSNTNPVYQKILKYIKDGSHIPKNSRLELKTQTHNIFQFKSKVKVSSPEENRHLLWFKTTPNSVEKLSQNVDGCISFYDRIARAISINPRDITEEPLRQVVLLFSVSLGRGYESPRKYQDWRDKELPQGYNSVKTMGKFVPDGRSNLEDNSAMIPCGDTVENGAWPTYEADYNEYIIYEIKRAQLMYAVDVEYIPCERRHDKVEAEDKALAKTTTTIHPADSSSEESSSGSDSD